MTIMLFGVSCVGKTTTGKLLAEELGYEFYDLDDEVKKYFHTTLEAFVHTGSLQERDKKRTEVLTSLVQIPKDKVIAVCPITYTDDILPLIHQKDVLAIILSDTIKNIFNRMVFSDENDQIYANEEYKQEHRDYYMDEIRGDISYYSYCYSAIKKKFRMKGESPAQVVDRLIKEYKLK